MWLTQLTHEVLLLLAVLSLYEAASPTRCYASVLSTVGAGAREGLSTSGHQIHPCGTHASTEDALYAQEIFRNTSFPTPGHRRRQGPLRRYTFDVQWNVVATNFTYLGGWIPDSFITAQMAVLNGQFEGTGITWNQVGTQRIMSRYWHEAITTNTTVDIMQLASTFRVGGPETMNVYTLGFYREPASGFSSLPVQYSRNPARDGVFLQYDLLPGGSRSDRQGGTLTHEAGHWLGLLHTFEGGCTGVGDGVDDTPAEAEPAFGCPIGRNSCPGDGPDPIHNYMDYTSEACRNEFTTGQINLMHRSIEAFRLRGRDSTLP
ncbi:hypothetical protein NMY22_g2046 [Coprinellus aureogranulatus]|nr:hypothetical protein NMY22_g2046 [Coprinellus aureogranulatus]